MKKILLLSLLGLLLTLTSSAQTLINGAGSTFDYPALTMWFEAYAKVDPGARFNYQSIGSGGGIRQLMSQTVAFGASDAPLTDAMMAKAPGPIIHVPIVAGAVVMSYNLPGNPKLLLDGNVIAGIYLGKVVKWNDASIDALNPGVQLPDLPIVVVHRSDGSGTSFIFTDYLSTVSPQWASQVGKSTSVNWPVGIGGKGNEGVSGQVSQLPGAIGYIELAYAIQNQLLFAALKNAAGNVVQASPDSVSAAMATADIPADFRFSMVNAPGDQAYPIAGASWVLVYQDQSHNNGGRQLIKFLRWVVTAGQKLSPKLEYAPLPESVQQRVLKTLDSVTY